MRVCAWPLLVWLAAAASAGEMPAARSSSWEPCGAWKVRRTVSVPPADKSDGSAGASPSPGADCCYVSFPTAGHLQADGRDLRVIIGGSAAPFKVIDIAYGGVVRLVAAVPKQADQMLVYYGNPNASAVASDWTPSRGLWLETRRYMGGDCTTLAGIRDAWTKARDHRDGAGAAAQVFHAFNPFGPSDNYLSHYTGMLVLAKDTPVDFAVSADDIGFVLVNGRPVAVKNTWGGMPQGRQLTEGTVQLSAGLHPIEVYHVQKDGDRHITAAWWMPGMSRGQLYKHYQVIPPNAFAPLRYGRPVDYEVQGEPLGVDFAANDEGDVLLDESKLLVRYVFRDASCPAPRALQCTAQWDFGDGTTSASREPSHVFLRPGDTTVTLTLRHGERAWQASQKLRVGFSYSRLARRQGDELAHYYAILKEYQFDKMATEDVVLAARVFEELEKPEEIVASCRVLYERRKDLPEATLVRHCLLLGRHLRGFAGEKGGQADANSRLAIEVFSYAEQHTSDLKAKARLANEQGDVYHFYLHDLASAEKEYTKTLTAYAKAGDSQVRLAQVRIGDLYRTKGDGAAARKAYEKAADMAINTYSDLVATARRGAFPGTVEDYLRRGMLKEAGEALDDWEWEFPEAKLEGYSSLLRARVALARNDTQEAVKQCEELVRVNKDSEYADDLLLFLADVHEKAGQLDLAIAAVARLLQDYPASELQEQAHLKRASLQMAAGKFAEASAEALELAAKHEDSPNAPKALLLAARALVKQNKTDDAVRTLARLSQKYATTEEATQAIKMLKELRRP
jgi:TolA-binding protein